MPFINIIPIIQQYGERYFFMAKMATFLSIKTRPFVCENLRKGTPRTERYVFNCTKYIIALQSAGKFLVFGKIIIIKRFASTYVLCYLRINRIKSIFAMLIFNALCF